MEAGRRNPGCDVGFWSVAQCAREVVAGPEGWWTACVTQRLVGRAFAAHVRNRRSCVKVRFCFCASVMIVARLLGVFMHRWVVGGAALGVHSEMQKVRRNL